MAKKYRKKPVEIEAIRYGTEYGAFHEAAVEEVAQFILGTNEPLSDYQMIDVVRPKGNWADGYKLEILDQVAHNEWLPLALGDYLIKGVNGEFYPCKPDIFEATYEPVDE